MSATLPPTADFERPSDFGEFWQQAEAAPPPVPSIMPEAEAPPPALTPEQLARRLRLRRAVGGVVLGLLAFTALAACVYVVKSQSAGSSSALVADKPVATAPAPSEPEAAPARSSAPVSQLVSTAAPSETDQALALAQAPVATIANLQIWSRLAGRLGPADRQQAEHDLSRLSVKGSRSVQEAARLQLALLWRASARRAKAQKVLVSLARTATDPVVKKYAIDTLRSA
jgi:hypothetical protein